MFATTASTEPGVRAQALQVTRAGDRLEVSVGGTSRTRPLADCGPIRIDPAADLPLPVVDALIAAPGAGVRVDLVADTRWETRASVTKIAVGVVALLLVVAAVTLAARAGLGARAPNPTSPNPTSPNPTSPNPTSPDAAGGSPAGRSTDRRRIRGWDVAVPVLLVLAWLIGPGTDDDGFLIQIIRQAGDTGFVGNYVRWLNAPEAPFGWFYRPYAWWAQVSLDPRWLRLPALLLGGGLWAVLRYGLLPRLRAELSPCRWHLGVLAVGFGVGWWVFGNTLRPENLFALGLALSTWLTLRAVERRQAGPLLLAVLIAGLTVGVGPVGLVALVPVLLGVRRLGVADRRIALALGTVCLAAYGSVVLLMFADQSWAGMAAANRVRTDFGPVFAPWQEGVRWTNLRNNQAVRQIVVYAAVAVLAAVLVAAWRRRRARGHRSGGAAAPLTGLLPWLAVGLGVVLILSPTKIPHHFGAGMGVYPLLLVLAVDRARFDRWVAGLLGGGVLVAVGLGLTAPAKWWEYTGLGLLGNGRPQTLGGIAVGWLVVVLGLLVAGVIVVAGRRGLRPVVALIAPVALLLLLVGQLGNFGQAAVRGGWSLGAANLGLTGRCGIESALAVELDPAAGVLTPESAIDLPAGGPWQLPTWTATAAEPTWRSPDYRLTGRPGDLVVSVTAATAGRVRVSFDTGQELVLDGRADGAGERAATGITEAVSDLSVAIPAGASRVRVSAEATDPGRGFAVAAPRQPIRTPLLDLADRTAASWTLAFVAPCLQQPVLAAGQATISPYLLSTGLAPGSMTYQTQFGGPFAAVLSVSEAVPLPVTTTDPRRGGTWLSGLHLVRLEPKPLRPLAPVDRAEVPRAGWR
ncbi:arabinosyltransferase domain-containing protein [Granulicoccus phenolivorans]|uniref:arabinosyltransferase domain-containing protein n=1 Tax=Granulicoccus phenolivorans TaxID=266854 RepID=UPI0003FF4D5A|nr:arabinosyltransferase domain-containing protein [Granulicoccus phenolivorans]